MAVKKVALITGIWGQDGTLLAKSLLDKDYQVLGVARPASSKKSSIGSESLQIIELNLVDLNQVKDLFQKYEIDECYHLAACHHESTKSD
jgi:GDPmannose 4,6-dehydratase